MYVFLNNSQFVFAPLHTSHISRAASLIDRLYYPECSNCREVISPPVHLKPPLFFFTFCFHLLSPFSCLLRTLHIINPLSFPRASLVTISRWIVRSLARSFSPFHSVFWILISFLLFLSFVLSGWFIIIIAPTRTWFLIFPFEPFLIFWFAFHFIPGLGRTSSFPCFVFGFATFLVFQFIKFSKGTKPTKI